MTSMHLEFRCSSALDETPYQANSEALQTNLTADIDVMLSPNDTEG